MVEELPASATHEMIETNDVVLHTIISGPPDGEPMVLLHGFPEFWYGWRSQIPTLVDAGYRVIVPDQRGYNRSEKPAGVSAYSLDTLSRDAVGLLDALGYEEAQFVGHDWGASVLWYTLLAQPERVSRGVLMNVPHPAVSGRFLLTHPSQILRSSYILFFQLPKIPERVLGADNWHLLSYFTDTSNRSETFTDADMARYRDAWSQSGACTGMLNWYRALVQDRPALPRIHVDSPTMLIWGTQDPFLDADLAQESFEYCLDGRLELIDDATHWVQHEAADRVNDLLLEFLN